ncbi:MAG: hypothetical protein RMJ53_06815 [Chitinophagales bacterium]|nr:hypothetical protein [Chitinophagales bacterium]MDW8273921.1 hypothetical protein [Chitinophagales bacterium]
MKQTFTQHDLILAAYGELTPAALLNLECEMAQNPSLSNDFFNIQRVKEELNSMMLKPSPSSLEIIMQSLYSDEQVAMK